jgi:hypothetical protein
VIRSKLYVFGGFSTYDVKATENGLKGPIGVGLIPTINSHARVEFFQALALSGNEPIAVPEPAPKRVHAVFVDESAAPPTVIAERDLTKNGTDANGNAIWDNSGSPLDVNVGTKDRIGVRIALSGQAGSVTCGDPLVDCYDSASTNGLVFVRGWKTAALVQNVPQARSVTLTSSTCADAYFTVATCNVAVRADVDFGTGINDPRPDTPTGVRAALRAVVGGNTYDMSWSGGHWTSAESIPVAATAGPITIGLQWAEQRATGQVNGQDCRTQGQPFASQNNCQGTINNVQRTFGGGPSSSGPIQVIQIQQGGIAGANSLRQCDSTNPTCTYPLVVKLSLQGTLANAQSASDPVVVLRDGSNNQPGTIDCDPNISNLKDEIARIVNGQVVRGCDPAYTPNTGASCPNSPTVLWARPQPWDCAAVSTGASVGQISDGFNLMILGDDKANSCTHPNLYTSNFGNWDPGDPRIVQLLLTPFGSFSGTGNGTVPVTGFATFYVTGWRGNADKNPCQGNGDDTAPKGGVVGHFIKYVDTLGQGGGTDFCDFDALGTCVAVLTR